jgi:FHA domain/zinc-ribbon domain
MPFCTRCGHANPAGSRFCSQCGTALNDERPAEQTATIAAIPLEAAEYERYDADLQPQEQAAVDELPPGCALLIVQRGPGSGSRYLLDTEVVTAGRHPDSDIFLDDVTVSRRHAEFRRASDGYIVRDVGSLNGTYVNRDRIDEVSLAAGDEVQIGKFRLRYFTAARGAGPGPGYSTSTRPGPDSTR